jgi:hypothetical protein
VQSPIQWGRLEPCTAVVTALSLVTSWHTANVHPRVVNRVCPPYLAKVVRPMQCKSNPILYKRRTNLTVSSSGRPAYPSNSYVLRHQALSSNQLTHLHVTCLVLPLLPAPPPTGLTAPAASWSLVLETAPQSSLPCSSPTRPLQTCP